MPAITIQDLENAKTDVDHIAEVATSQGNTATDRLGHVKQTLAGAVGSIAAITDRGAWSTGAAYLVKDLVTVEGIVYVCVSGHTAGVTFAGDSAKWRVHQGLTVADMANDTDPAKGAGLVGRSDQIVQSVTALKLLSKTAASQTATTLGYYLAGDGGGGNYYLDTADTLSVDNGGSVIVSVDGGRWKLRNPKSINVRQFGSKGDGITDDTSAIRAAIAALRTSNGGTLYFPAGSYKVSTNNPSEACLWVDFDYCRFIGEGDASEIFVADNAHVPIHVSPEQDLTLPPSSGYVSHFICENLKVRGTGNYEYFALAKGRGVLVRSGRNVFIRNNTVVGMSMIGICTEYGDGYFEITNNRVVDCFYTAINFNGRAYQSLIQGNICSGSNSGIDSIAIQATGPCLVVGNTIFGDPTNHSNCGGIMWGEGNYDGIGGVQNNLVKNCRFGIKAVYHGAALISGNTILNCMTLGGIVLVGGSEGGFTVANSDNLVSANMVVNCYPYGIDCSANNTLLSGNKIRGSLSAINPSASTEPDYLVTTTPEAGIHVTASSCSVVGNDVSGCIRGLTTTITKVNGVISANHLNGNTIPYGVESLTPGIFAEPLSTPIERVNFGESSYIERLYSSVRPSSGHYSLGSKWIRTSPGIGVSVGEVVVFKTTTTTSAPAPAGATSIALTSTVGVYSSATETVVGIELDNGVWHWTTVTAINSPSITIAAPVPTGRSVLSGANILYNHWRALAALA